MKIEQVQEYCEEALRLAEHEGTHAGLSFLIGEKFGLNFSLLRKARQKLQFLSAQVQFDCLNLRQRLYQQQL